MVTVRRGEGERLGGRPSQCSCLNGQETACIGCPPASCGPPKLRGIHNASRAISRLKTLVFFPILLTYSYICTLLFCYGTLLHWSYYTLVSQALISIELRRQGGNLFIIELRSWQAPFGSAGLGFRRSHSDSPGEACGLKSV